MDRTLSEIFIQERRQPIEYQGMQVYSRWPLEVHEGQKLLVRLQFNRTDLRQAVSLKIKEGIIEHDGERAQYIAFWDSGPTEVEVICHPGKQRMTSTLWIWNHWESEGGRVDAGLNNAGIIVEETSVRRTVLRCSPGRWADEPPDFSAVWVEIAGQSAT